MLSYLTSPGDTSKLPTVMAREVEALKVEGIHRLVKENKDVPLDVVGHEQV